MNLATKCPKHPTYKAKRRPRATTKHPEGCWECWVVFERAEVERKAAAC